MSRSAWGSRRSSGKRIGCGDFPHGFLGREAEPESAEGWRVIGSGGGEGDGLFELGEATAPFGEFALAAVGIDGGAGPRDVGELRHEGGQRDIFFG